MVFLNGELLARVLDLVQREEEEARTKLVLGGTGGSKKLADIEYEHIAKTIAECKGNVTWAAAVIGITRRSLLRRINKHEHRLRTIIPRRRREDSIAVWREGRC
jgi:transcriptional regulator of acetoin/glycerol metabolism